MLVEPARPQSWRSGSSCPSSGERFTSPTELRGAADAHHSSLGPTHRARERASERATGAGGQSRPEHRTHEAAVKLRYVPDKRGALAFKSDLVNFCSSPVMESRASPAWFHVPMLVYFPGCTADFGWKFVVFLPST